MRTDIPALPSGNADTRQRAAGFSGRVRFDAGACLSVRYPDLDCGLCIPACPPKAIAIGDDGPALSGECTGCGRCAAACPTAAASVDGFAVPASLPEGGGPVDVDCWRVPVADSAPGTLRVPCLGGVDAGWLLAVFALAGERRLRLLDRGGCAGCPAGAGDSVAAVLDEARSLLAEAGVAESRLPVLVAQPQPSALLPSIPSAAEACAVDRRAFFRNLVGGVARGVDDIRAPAAPAPISSPRHAVRPVGRLRVVAALAQVAASHGRSVPSRVLPALSIADCGAHGVCAAVCPTGALRRQMSTDGVATGLEFNGTLCIACGQCERACPERALRVSPEGGRPGSQVLARWTENECAECGEHFFGAAGDRCPDCIRQTDLRREFSRLDRGFA